MKKINLVYHRRSAERNAVIYLTCKPDVGSPGFSCIEKFPQILCRCRQRGRIIFFILFLILYSRFCSIPLTLCRSSDGLFPCAPTGTVAEHVVRVMHWDAVCSHIFQDGFSTVLSKIRVLPRQQNSPTCESPQVGLSYLVKTLEIRILC